MTLQRLDGAWQALVSPIERIVDLERFGQALLLTSECDGGAWQPGGPFEDGPKLLLPGGKYSARSQKRYREQSLLAVQLVSDALLRAGVPAEHVRHADFCDGAEGDPVELIQRFWSDALNPVTRHRDALIYYFGFSLEGGQWVLTWTNKGGSKVCILDPTIILPPPGEEDGVPGARFVVADAPGTARLWMRPARRLRGVGAWRGAAAPGGSGGPPLARWLAGYMPEPPHGVVAFLDPPPEVGLEDLPCWQPLFWGPSPPASSQRSKHLLWELTEFVGAGTMVNHRVEATEEILIKGGPQMLLSILEAQVMPGEDDLALQLLWLLQTLASEAPTHRWADTMNEALKSAMSLVKRLGPPPSPEIYAALLSFMAGTASQCPVCREECAKLRWPRIRQLIMEAFDVDNEAAAVAGCRMVAQVAAHHPLEVEEHQDLISRLLQMLLQGGGELIECASEALLFVTLRCNENKLKVLELLSKHPGFFSTALACSKSNAVERVLMFLRSLASAQPSSAVLEAFPDACMENGIIEMVIRCLRHHATAHDLQRWGLATLGSLAACDEQLAHGAVERGGAQCVMWALGAEVLSQAKSLEQDTLFCAYALLSTELGQEQLAPASGGALPLVASAIARALREDASEAAMWGIRIFERICLRHCEVVEPYVEVILDAMRAENCLHGTMVAASNTVATLASKRPRARQKLVKSYVSLVKALQCMGHLAALEGEQGRERQSELLDWVQVLVDILGPPRPLKSDDQRLAEQLAQEVTEQEENNSNSKSGSKSNTGTKSNPGTKSRTGTKLDAGSTGGGTKETTRSKSNLPTAGA